MTADPIGIEKLASPLQREWPADCGGRVMVQPEAGYAQAGRVCLAVVHTCEIRDRQASIVSHKPMTKDRAR